MLKAEILKIVHVLQYCIQIYLDLDPEQTAYFDGFCLLEPAHEIIQEMQKTFEKSYTIL